MKRNTTGTVLTLAAVAMAILALTTTLVLFALVVALPSTASADLLVYEPFDYPPDAILTGNGGSPATPLLGIALKSSLREFSSGCIRRLEFAGEILTP